MDKNQLLGNFPRNFMQTVERNRKIQCFARKLVSYVQLRYTQRYDSVSKFIATVLLQELLANILTVKLK